MSNFNVDKIQKKEILLKKASQLAFNFEKEKHCCSQCTVAALQDVFQIKNEGIFSASFALGGGLADTCEGTCGALSGGGNDNKLFLRTPTRRIFQRYPK